MSIIISKINIIKLKPPLPREPLGDDALRRPDWTKIARSTSGLLALDKNENLDPDLKKIIADIISDIPVEAVIEYPECSSYYGRLANYLGVKPENLLFTPGSDGAIRSVFETFLSPGQTVIQTMPSFAMYPLYTKIYGGITFGLSYSGREIGPVLEVGSIC